MDDDLFELETPLETGIALPAAPEINLTQFELASLAREIAMDIKPRAQILARFKISDTLYAHIEKHPAFERVLTAAVIEWNAAKSTPERLKIEAAAILEEALPYLGARMIEKTESLAMQVQAGTLLTKIAGIGEQTRDGVAQGEKFVISINLGADTERYERNRTPTITVESSQPALPDNSKGTIDAGS